MSDYQFGEPTDGECYSVQLGNDTVIGFAGDESEAVRKARLVLKIGETKLAPNVTVYREPETTKEDTAKEDTTKPKAKASRGRKAAKATQGTQDAAAGDQSTEGNTEATAE